MSGTRATFSQEWWRTSLASIGDGVIACDATGNVIFLNPVAEALTGWSKGEAEGRALDQIFPIINAETRKAVENPATRVLREGIVLGLANHTILITKDGREIPIDDSSAPIRDEHNNLVGVILVFRDITERWHSELARLHLAAIVESSDDAIIGKTLDGTITSWNSGAENMYGYSAQEALGLPISIITPPERAAEIPTILVRLQRGERVDHYETVRVRKDGTRLDVSVTISPIKNKEGTIVGASAIAREITGRKRAEEALRKSEAQLNGIIASAMDAIIAVDADQRIILFNSAAEAMFRCSASEALQLPLDRFIPERFRRAHREHIPSFGATNVTRRSMGELGTIYGLRADGEEFPIEASISQIEIGAQKHYTVILRDVTARKRGEEELERLLVREQVSRTEVEKAMEMIRQIQAVSDLALQHATIENLLPDMLKRVRELLHTDYISILLISDDGRSLIKRSAFGPDGAINHEIQIPVGSGILGRIAASRAPLCMNEFAPTEHDIDLIEEDAHSLIGAPLLIEGRPIGVIHADSVAQREFAQDDLRLLQLVADRIALSIDHARLFEAEQAARLQAEDANRLKDEFLATVSHELRNPLHSMLGWLHLLRGGRLSLEARDRALDTVERNARTQHKLVEDLLDVSRFITGKLRLNVRPVELAPVIEAAVEALEPAADAKGIRIETILDPQTEAISGDPDRLQQVVWNLISNAIKFTPKGGRIQVRLERVNSHVEVIVSDTGAGIDPGFLPYVFDRFRQAEGSSSRPQGGLGLGLAIVRHLTELHGGTVQAQSGGQGQGATFVVRLPLMVTRIEAPGERIHPKAPLGVKFDVGVSLSRLRVLVLDDDPDAREVLTGILENYNAQVKAVSTGEEALQAMATWKPDVLISDIEMPHMDGYDLIRRVRSLEAESGSGRTPAVALTAYARIEDRLRALAAGFQIHVPKPVEPAELAMVVASLSGRLGHKTTSAR